MESGIRQQAQEQQALGDIRGVPDAQRFAVLSTYAEGRVRAAYLQLSPPSLLEAVTAAAQGGFRRIAVLPLFISAGGHVMRDVLRVLIAGDES